MTPVQTILTPGIGWLLIFPMLWIRVFACIRLSLRPSAENALSAKRLAYGPLSAGGLVVAFGIVEAFVFDIAGDPEVRTYLIVALLDTVVLTGLLRAFAYAASTRRGSADGLDAAVSTG